VEFALIMLPLLYLVFGVIQYSLFFYSMQAGTSAVGDAARRIAVGDSQNTSDLKALLKDRLGGGTTTSAGNLNPSITYYKAPPNGATSIAAPGEAGGQVTITLTYPTMNLHFPFIPVPNNGDVTRTLTARVEDTTPTNASVSTQGCT
jgi:Flp pilus assembly protein TadG